jgi:hypothetical protein
LLHFSDVTISFFPFSIWWEGTKPKIWRLARFCWSSNYFLWLDFKEVASLLNTMQVENRVKQLCNCMIFSENIDRALLNLLNVKLAADVSNKLWKDELTFHHTLPVHYLKIVLCGLRFKAVATNCLCALTNSTSALRLCIFFFILPHIEGPIVILLHWYSIVLVMIPVNVINLPLMTNNCKGSEQIFS